MARALAQAGASVAIAARHAEELEAALPTILEGTSARGAWFVADMGRRDQVEGLARQAAEALGPIDILVNNAGRATFQSIDQMTEASWNETLAVNLTSVFLLSQAVLPGMRARKWGRIINLTSVAAQAGSVLAVHYSAAKAGVIAATKSYARLLAKEGITVNAIAPALIGTEMVVSNPHVKPDIVPVGRFGSVEECADVAVLLASNGYITGQTIAVNGGMYLTS